MKKIKFYLASGSPRRQELLEKMGITFEYKKINVEEVFPPNLKAYEITNYLAELKSKAVEKIGQDEVLITADTIVWFKDKALGKPTSRSEAKNMLLSMSDSTHQVFSSVTVRTEDQIHTFYDSTDVKIKSLREIDVDYYLNNFEFMDKAGAYGIQDWFGLTCVESLDGSYYNVMGFPTEKLYQLFVDLKLI